MVNFKASINLIGLLFLLFIKSLFSKQFTKEINKTNKINENKINDNNKLNILTTPININRIRLLTVNADISLETHISSDFYHIIDVSIGTPPQNFNMLLSLGYYTTVNNRVCEKCFDTLNKFNTTNSTTYITNNNNLDVVMEYDMQKTYCGVVSSDNFKIKNSEGNAYIYDSKLSFLLLNKENFFNSDEYDGILSVGRKKVDEKTIAKTDEKTLVKTDEKPEEKTEEKPKTDEKSIETNDDKSKTDGKPIEKSDDKPIEKSDEKPIDTSNDNNKPVEKADNIIKASIDNNFSLLEKFYSDNLITKRILTFKNINKDADKKGTIYFNKVPQYIINDQNNLTTCKMLTPDQNKYINNNYGCNITHVLFGNNYEKEKLKEYNSQAVFEISFYSMHFPYKDFNQFENALVLHNCKSLKNLNEVFYFCPKLKIESFPSFSIVLNGYAYTMEYLDLFTPFEKDRMIKNYGILDFDKIFEKVDPTKYMMFNILFSKTLNHTIIGTSFLKKFDLVLNLEENYVGLYTNLAISSRYNYTDYLYGAKAKSEIHHYFFAIILIIIVVGVITFLVITYKNRNVTMQKLQYDIVYMPLEDFNKEKLAFDREKRHSKGSKGSGDFKM